MKGVINISNDLNLKKIFLNDAIILYSLMQQIYPPVYNHLWEDQGDWYVNTIFSIQNLQKELLEINAAYYFIQSKNEIIGILRMVHDTKLIELDNKKSTKLHRIYLDPKVHNKGIGKMLMNFVMQKALENRSEILWLEVMDTQTQALRFYQDLNFQIISNFKLQFDLMYPHFKGMHRMCRFL